MAVIPLVTEIDFSNPRGNRDAWARIQTGLDSSRQRIYRRSGTILAVRRGAAVKPFLGVQTFLCTRLLPLPDGNIRRVNREVIFYTSLKRGGQPGEIIDSDANPFIGKSVRVVHAVNDAFNCTISDTLVMAPGSGCSRRRRSASDSDPREPRRGATRSHADDSRAASTRRRLVRAYRRPA